MGTKKPLLGAGEEPIEETLIGRRRESSEQVLSAAEALDLELLAGLDLVLLTELFRDDDLTLGGDGDLHAEVKVQSCRRCVKRSPSPGGEVRLRPWPRLSG